MTGPDLPALWEQGLTTGEIAALLGMTPEGVRYRARRDGLPARQPGRPPGDGTRRLEVRVPVPLWGELEDVLDAGETAQQFALEAIRGEVERRWRALRPASDLPSAPPPVG